VTAHPHIVLLTDLGLSDPYVGQMKGVLHRLAPGVPVFDLSHSVPRHDVRTGAFFLTAALPHFPDGAVFLAVVDPGVGTDRGLLCLYSEHRACVAPNNGLPALAAENFPWSGIVCVDPHAARRGLNLPPPSSTFHGRDVIAPLGARLALGGKAADFGRAADMTELYVPPWSAAQRTEDGIRATVLHVDVFGNVVLNLAVEEWREPLATGNPNLPRYNLPVPLCASYEQLPREGAGLISGSQGYFELARNRASAAKFLGLKPGYALHIGL
jgi:S-adenosylmethionine hydrolase